jgi:hypothetical protein
MEMVRKTLTECLVAPAVETARGFFGMKDV